MKNALHGEWVGDGSSVLGANHEASGLPNQDAIAWTDDAHDEALLGCAVSDGHGSLRCFRSHLGARFGVQSAIETLVEYERSEAESDGQRIDRERVRQWFAKEIHRRWRLRVSAHLEGGADAPPCPIDEDAAALEKLKGKHGERAVAEIRENPVLAYGATVVAALVTRRSILYLQLGDGDVVSVDPSGRAAFETPQRAGETVGEETESLCQKPASVVESFWANLVPVDADHPAPALVLVATDGYRKSFKEDKGFLSAGSDFLAMIRAHGFARVAESLPGWLSETTHGGAGDDTTVGLLYRTTAPVQSPAPAGTASEAGGAGGGSGPGAVAQAFRVLPRALSTATGSVILALLGLLALIALRHNLFRTVDGLQAALLVLWGLLLGHTVHKVGDRRRTTPTERSPPEVSRLMVLPKRPGGTA